MGNGVISPGLDLNNKKYECVCTVSESYDTMITFDDNTPSNN